MVFFPRQWVILMALLPMAVSSTSTNLLSSLASYLDLETCDIYLLNLSHEDIETLSSELHRPFLIDSSDFSLPRCRVAVTNVFDHPDLSRQVPVFTTVYVIQGDPDALENIVLSFELPKIIFRTTANDHVSVSRFCGVRTDVEIVNVFREGQNVFPVEVKDICKDALRGQNIKVSIYGLAPFVIYPDGPGELRGSDPKVIDILSSAMGFRYEWILDSQWGNPVQGNSDYWTGIIGRNLNRTSQMGIGSIVILETRAKVIDYSTPLYTLNMHFLAAKPKPLNPYMNFLKPFSLEVWLLLGLVLVLMTLGSAIHTCLIPTAKRRHRGFAVFFKITLTQHVGPNEYNPWMRSNFFLSWIFLAATTLLLFSYDCNLRAYLMQVDFEKPLDSEQDMLDLNRRLYLPLGTPLRYLFSTTPFKDQQAIFKTIEKNNQYFRFVNGFPPLELEKKGDAMMFGEIQAYAALETSFQRHGYVAFRVGKKPIIFFWSGMVMPKKAPWKTKVDEIILSLQQGGIINKLVRDFVPPRYLREEPPDTSPKPFMLSNIFGSVICFGVGVIISLVVFIVEVIFVKSTSLSTVKAM